MHSKLLRLFAVLEVYSRRLLLFLTSEARTEEKKKGNAQFLKKQKYKHMNGIHNTFYQLSVLNLPSSLQNGETYFS